MRNIFAVVTCLVHALGTQAVSPKAPSSLLATDKSADLAPGAPGLPGAPAVAPAGAPAPHFATSTLGLLRSSGSHVSHAVQRILGVQGSLDDLKEDLSTEYSRWKAKQKSLLVKRQRLDDHIRDQQAELLEQKSLRALAARLRGDAALATHAYAVQNQSHRESREVWRKEQAALSHEIQELLQEIDATHQNRHIAVATAHNKTDALRKREVELNVEIMANNKTVSEFETTRAKHTVGTSRTQGELLGDMSVLQKGLDKLKIDFVAQRKLEWEHKRLADQAREVVKLREELASERVDCNAQIQNFNQQLAATGEKMQEATAQLRRCQAMQADVTGLQRKANACRAATLAGSSTG